MKQPFQLQGYVPCYGMQIVLPDGKYCIVGVKDILSNAYTYDTIVQAGREIIPVTCPNNPQNPDPTDQNIW